MRDQCHNPPAGQFVRVEEAAKSLNLDTDVLRKAIACGLVPIRRDNEGGLRVHMDDVPGDLQERLQGADVQLELQVATLSDQVLTLQRQHNRLDAQRQRLEALVVRQAELLNQHTGTVWREDSESRERADSSATTTDLQPDANHAVQRLTHLLERTYRAVDEQERQTSEQTARFIETTDNAMRLLEQAVCKNEEHRGQIAMLQQQLSASVESGQRLEDELKQRDSVISSQQGLLDRMVTMAERTTSGSSDKEHATSRKRTFWQRLWGSGKGI